MKKFLFTVFMLMPLFCMAQREKFTQENFKPSANVVEVVDNQMALDIDVIIPPEFFGRNTIAEITPLFRWGRKEVAGRPIFLQGEMVDDSYRIVGYKLGVNDKLSIKLDYELGMEDGKFLVNVKLSSAVNKRKKMQEVELPVRIDQSVLLVYETVKDAAFYTFKLENGGGGVANSQFYRAQNIKNPSERMGALDQALVYNPNDHRIVNNIAMCYLERGDVEMAEETLHRALDLNPASPEVNANLCLLALRRGDLSAASDFLSKSEGADNYNEAFGTMLLARGQVPYAVGKLGEVNTNTAILACVLNQDYAMARRKIDAIPVKNGMTYYLQALMGVKTHNREMVGLALDNLMMVDPRLYAKTRKDPEFENYSDLFKKAVW